MTAADGVWGALATINRKQHHGLRPRLGQALHRLDIKTWENLADTDVREFLALKNTGISTVAQICAWALESGHVPPKGWERLLFNTLTPVGLAGALRNFTMTEMERFKAAASRSFRAGYIAGFAAGVKEARLGAPA